MKTTKCKANNGGFEPIAYCIPMISKEQVQKRDEDLERIDSMFIYGQVIKIKFIDKCGEECEISDLSSRQSWELYKFIQDYLDVVEI